MYDGGIEHFVYFNRDKQYMNSQIIPDNINPVRLDIEETAFLGSLKISKMR